MHLAREAKANGDTADTAVTLAINNAIDQHSLLRTDTALQRVTKAVERVYAGEL